MEYLYYYIFLIFIIITVSYIGTLSYAREKKQENFTPFIRQKYRPYVRNVRILTEGFYNEQKNNITNLFRRFGIM